MSNGTLCATNLLSLNKSYISICLSLNVIPFDNLSSHPQKIHTFVRFIRYLLGRICCRFSMLFHNIYNSPILGFKLVVSVSKNIFQLNVFSLFNQSTKSLPNASVAILPVSIIIPSINPNSYNAESAIKSTH